MRAAVTGHQPPALGGYGADVFARLVGLGRGWIRANRPTEVVSGMAAGWDLAMAEAAVLEGVPLVAALAFRGQGEDWPDEARAHLRRLLGAAVMVHVANEARVPGMWTIRDRWVLERGDVVVALWSGADDGTGRAVAKARELGKQVDNLWPSWAGIAA